MQPNDIVLRTGMEGHKELGAHSALLCQSQVEEVSSPMKPSQELCPQSPNLLRIQPISLNLFPCGALEMPLPTLFPTKSYVTA
jgi:hypothetical protein